MYTPGNADNDSVLSDFPNLSHLSQVLRKG